MNEKYKDSEITVIYRIMYHILIEFNNIKKSVLY